MKCRTEIVRETPRLAVASDFGAIGGAIIAIIGIAVITSLPVLNVTVSALGVAARIGLAAHAGVAVSLAVSVTGGTAVAVSARTTVAGRITVTVTGGVSVAA
jgi:hypothetical protein